MFFLLICSYKRRFLIEEEIIIFKIKMKFGMKLHVDNHVYIIKMKLNEERKKL